MTLTTGRSESFQCAWMTGEVGLAWRVMRMNADAGLASESASAPLRRTAMRNRVRFMVARPPLPDRGGIARIDLRLALKIEIRLDSIEERAQRLVARDLALVHRSIRGEHLETVQLVPDVLQAGVIGHDRVFPLLKAHDPRIARLILGAQEEDGFFPILEGGHARDDGDQIAHGAAELADRDRLLALRALDRLENADGDVRVDFLVAGILAAGLVHDLRHDDGLGLLGQVLERKLLDRSCARQTRAEQRNPGERD